MDYNQEYYPKLCFWKKTVNANKQKAVSKLDFNPDLSLGGPVTSFVHFHLPDQILSLYSN